jgi:hypothetical protein
MWIVAIFALAFQLTEKGMAMRDRGRFGSQAAVSGGSFGAIALLCVALWGGRFSLQGLEPCGRLLEQDNR